jgi:hypothetical protein
MIYIGIDPGVNTGLALWCPRTKLFLDIQTVGILDAMELVLEYRELYDGEIQVIFEDARLRGWFGKSGREVLQGAGSIKRDCQIWEEFLIGEGILFTKMKPAAGKTKWTTALFSKATGWLGKTNVHGRDAAMLVFGRK